MSVLARKLRRELWQLRAQVLAIGVVIGGGVATLIMAVSSLRALTETRDGFYRDYRFADVFVSLTRAPEPLAERLAAIPGVARVETRIVAGANLEVPGFDQPVTARLVSLPEGQRPSLNDLFLRRGRLPRPGRAEEVVLSEAFAEAQDLSPGDTLNAVIYGRRQPLRVVGIGLSPEFIYQIRPGDFLPDHARYGVLWMNREALAAALDREGSFNDALIGLQRDAVEAGVITRLDALLAPYGSTGAIGRADQASHRYLASELAQIATMVRTVPTIFLGVAAFLLYVVMARLIATQREQIGVLKAFGYGNGAIGLHYAQLVLAIALVGYLMGALAGVWLGQHMAGLYATFFRFPYLEYGINGRVLIIAALVTAAAALGGSWGALRRAAGLPPAEAMRPAPPASFRPTLVERLGLARWLRPSARMMLRSLERRPLRALLSILAIAFACAILLIGRFQSQAIDALVERQFEQVQREDLRVSFNEPVGARALDELRALPGVLLAEGLRSAPVELIHGHRRYRLALQGLPAASELRRLITPDNGRLAPPAEGLLLTDYLAGLLAAAPGDRLTVRFLDERRATVELPVAGVIEEYLGVSAYLRRDRLSVLLREQGRISAALLAVSPTHMPQVLAELDRRPAVLGVTQRRAAVDSFYENMAGSVLIFTFVSTLLAASIAFGVVYNNARIALGERSRELASLRVLGYRRHEVAWILLGEQALLSLLAIPPGLLLGYGLYAAVAAASASEMFRIPVLWSTQAVVFTVLVLAAVWLLSAWAMARRVNRLDMVAVLKTRE
ncbi:ABC transporter permease [Alkalilimnicola sp. S0819]|uniref:ABC transporter permease n=1 Tax=Alkalilimnicola sp. S0819 TaxID=2613922 RepID=UPI0012615BBE|nr:FtsX-like permease family protein [Alkalilimnicola sp. S0819]KAB7624374.1 FtsX-like permease family protein [Alkalilimnicola sp. S0819]MPQ16200.1 FtsX-like permease family protein [Alkalilimnicola sp. S0819]